MTTFYVVGTYWGIVSFVKFYFWQMLLMLLLFLLHGNVIGIQII